MPGNARGLGRGPANEIQDECPETRFFHSLVNPTIELYSPST